MQNSLNRIVQKTIEATPAGALVHGYQLARSLGFTVQSLSLPLLEAVATGRTDRLREKGALKRSALAYRDLHRLLREDARRICEGIYPWTVLKPRPWTRSLSLYPRVLRDGFAISRRRSEKKAKDFGPGVQTLLRELPPYYRRNFHFQTDGYLSEESADLYEHQVEMLFSGAADAMRRLVLEPLRRHFGPGRGEGLRFLEIGGGTGRLSSFVKETFPDARLTVLDLSDAYLKKARAELQGWSRVDFLQGDGADLPFPGERFDAVFSCFLFHELPAKERERVLREGLRVLKPGGFHGLVDSIQLGDKPELDWALRRFPVDFHEPFYADYSKKPVEALFRRAGLREPSTVTGFFAKCVWARKPGIS